MARNSLLQFSVLAFLMTSLVSFHSHAGVRPKQEGQYLFEVVTAHNLTMHYAVYLPSNYSNQRSWPVILFLHGSDETGNDGIKQTKVGLGPAIEKNPERFPAIVLMPQSPSGTSFTSGSYAQPLEDLINEVLDDIIDKYNGDRSRVYLTGISRGGGGVWRYAAHRPDVWADIIPIAGFGEPDWIARPLKEMPIWAFHGSADTAVPVDMTRNLVKAVRNQGNTEVRYTEYKDAPHNVWDRTYANSKVIDWMFSHSNQQAIR